MARRKRPDFSRFYEWHEPTTLRDLCLAVNAALDEDPAYGPYANVIEAGLQPLLDAHTAADFGLTYGRHNAGVQVRLRPEPQPDFEVCTTDTPQMLFEATEADRPGRTRANEYRGLRATNRGLGELEHVDHDELVADRSVVAKVLAERVRAKAEKHYEDETGRRVTPHLLIRDNLRHDYTAAELAGMVARCDTGFPSIWLLEPSMRLVQLSPQLLELSGGAAFDRLPPIAPPLLKLW